jgi:hypothetical protein
MLSVEPDAGASDSVKSISERGCNVAMRAIRVVPGALRSAITFFRKLNDDGKRGFDRESARVLSSSR